MLSIELDRLAGVMNEMIGIGAGHFAQANHTRARQGELFLGHQADLFTTIGTDKCAIGALVDENKLAITKDESGMGPRNGRGIHHELIILVSANHEDPLGRDHLEAFSPVFDLKSRL